MKEQEIDALLSEGSDLIDALLAKSEGLEEEDKSMESDESDDPALVDFVHKIGMFKDAEPETIHEAAERVSALKGLSPSEAVDKLAEYDVLMALLTELATASDPKQMEGEDDD